MPVVDGPSRRNVLGHFGARAGRLDVASAPSNIALSSRSSSWLSSPPSNRLASRPPSGSTIYPAPFPASRAVVVAEQTAKTEVGEPEAGTMETGRVAADAEAEAEAEADAEAEDADRASRIKQRIG